MQAFIAWLSKIKIRALQEQLAIARDKVEMMGARLNSRRLFCF